jgi:hypothetical protein
MENWISYLIGIFLVGFIVACIFLGYLKKWNILSILVVILVVVGFETITPGYRYLWLDTIINNANK